MLCQSSRIALCQVFVILTTAFECLYCFTQVLDVVACRPCGSEGTPCNSSRKAIDELLEPCFRAFKNGLAVTHQERIEIEIKEIVHALPQA